MEIEITIENYVAPPKSPHPFAPHVATLIKAGPEKVATASFDTEEEALTFIRSMQTAAREVSHSARKSKLEQTDDGKWIAGVRVGGKITRSRNTNSEEETETKDNETKTKGK